MPGPTPQDVIAAVARELAAQGAQGTLASLARTGTRAYAVVAPELYRDLEVNVSSAGLFDLGPEEVAGFAGFGTEGEVLGHASPRAARRLMALSWTRRMRIKILPPDRECTPILAAAELLHANGHSLLPRLQDVCLLPTAVDQLRIWAPSSYDRDRNPPLLELLSLAQPKHLCLAFRLVPAVDWEEHRDLSTRGQYALVRRISLLASSWTLESATFHDIVHQVPPSLPTKNIYVFAPPAIPHPLFRGRYRYPSGRDAVRLPGPEWNIRPWQIALAVKNLFPSSTRAEHTATLQRTSWAFCRVEAHVLTKEKRDDDDTTGVWWEEVGDMIRGSVKVGIERDLPARDGVDAEFVRGVFDRLSYGRAAPCAACGRDMDEPPVMGLDGVDGL